jgi:hypothetical protein
MGLNIMKDTLSRFYRHISIPNSINENAIRTWVVKEECLLIRTVVKSFFFLNNG